MDLCVFRVTKAPRLGCPINQLNAHPSLPQHKIHADSEVETKVASRTLARLGKSFHSKSSLSVPLQRYGFAASIIMEEEEEEGSVVA